MPRQHQFPVQFSDNNCCDHSGATPSFARSLLLAAILAGCASLSHAAPSTSAQGGGLVVAQDAGPTRTQPFAGWAKGRLLIAPRAGLAAGEFENALKPHNGKSRIHLKKLNAHIVELPEDADEVAVMRELKKDHRLKYVELDMAVTHDVVVSDPYYSSSWALPKIQAPLAWDSANGSGVTIAILDTGVDSTHPDLASNIVPGWNIYNNNADTSDVHGHGTMVAGTAAMIANDGIGSAGVAWGAKIMPVRISAPDGSVAYYSTVAQGIYWAADHGARVVNISYSGILASSTIQSAAQYLRNKGGVVVVSAGNTGGLLGYAASDSILVAAATGSNDQRASWSSYGSYVDISAPGVSIYTTLRGGGYGNVSGTSISSPIVAATAALMISANNNLSLADIDQILKATAVDLGTTGYDNYYGAGRVDAAKAVVAAQSIIKTAISLDTQAPAILITSPVGSKVAGSVPVDVNYSDNVGVTRAELYVNGQKFATDDIAPFAFAWDTSVLKDGAYTLVAYAYDAAGNSGVSPTVSVTIGSDTVAPVISSFNLADGMTVSNKQTVQVSATDNQSIAKIALSIDGKQVAVAYGSSLSYSWNTRNIAKGAHIATVQAYDAANNTTSKTVTVYK
ncbi:S8 family serine peptidase [Candidatus Nitrotoga sp. 1052]|uniref:S8 family serine peptidase n=1 Tax=Candidatus Nitrotoga sp. 1052 TaxID=2886964 RepID=UPI001EF68372|nr:S8 family serine peptidase [Candidatus Nitrotoga sp. 1052]CAH1083221.1 Serine protease, subtilisin family [Candidatus Nitrotoga sp. 1052]